MTAMIHLQRGFEMTPSGPPGRPPGGGPGGPPGGQGREFTITRILPLPLSTLFVLNGLGYLVLGAALYVRPLHRYRRITRWLLIIFAGVTIISYFQIVGLRSNPVGLIDKSIELLLIALLIIEDRRGA